MIRRFSAYGFLKNQLYFEPFLVLIFLEKGLSFFQIGLLIAFREVVVNLFEVLSGAVADVWGRRRSMIISFSSYIVSFVVFGLADNILALFLAMAFFGIGESFRTGSHKAMIFAWLRSQGREDERTRVYGYTRSWSKMGSALSVVLAAVFVLVLDEYTPIFFVCIVPYLLGIINFLGYPKELDPKDTKAFSLREVFGHLKQSIVATAKGASLRRLMAESMGFEGTFRASKDYLQPVLQAAALVWGAQLVAVDQMGEPQKAALLVGPVFFVLYILSAWASRRTHKIATWAGGEDRAARWLWAAALIAFVVMAPAMYYGIYPLVIVAFIFLYVLQNAWRPILMARIDSRCDQKQGATVLSIENQAKSLGTMILAPLLGALVDLARNTDLAGEPFWPVGLFGLIVALIFVLWRDKHSSKECLEEPPG